MLKKTTTSKSINNISKRKLSIQFSLDGFSFSISNEQGEVFHFFKYSFEKSFNSPQELQSKVEEIFKNESLLHQEFDDVLVIHQNRLNTFVPTSYFKEESLSEYLSFSVKTLTNDLIVYDTLDLLDTVNVYIPYVNINNYLFQNFGEFEFKHHSSVVLENLLKYSTKDELELFAIVETNTLELYGLTSGSLTFYNSFDITSKEDFIYYLLFVLEQLKVDPTEATIQFTGDINKNSTYYSIANQYIKEVAFLEPKKHLLFESNEFENHSNFSLLG